MAIISLRDFIIKHADELDNIFSSNNKEENSLRLGKFLSSASYAWQGDYLSTEDYKKLRNSLFKVYPDLLENISTIPSHMFAGDRGFKNQVIDLPENIEVIDDSAFFNTNIIGINLPSTLKAIKAYAFQKSDLQSIEIPDNTNIDFTQIFQECSELESAKLPAYTSVVGHAMFSHCVSLKEILIPDSVIKIKGYAFNKCVSLSKVDISKNSNLKVIDMAAFAGCEALTSIYLPEGLEEIGVWAFKGCTNLKHLDLPKSLKEIRLEGLPTHLDKLVIPYEQSFEDLLKNQHLSLSSLRAAVNSIKYPIIFNGVEYENGKAFADAAEQAIKKITLPPLYKIATNNYVMVTLPNTKTPATVSWRSVVGLALENAPVFFLSEQDAQAFIDSYEQFKPNSTVSYSCIRLARPTTQDYASNFSEIKTVAGPCLIQGRKDGYINPANIIRKNIF